MALGQGQPKKMKIPDWEFDLEKDLKDQNKLRQIKNDMEAKVQQIKGFLREGGDKTTFDKAQILLQGFLAAQKVIGRIGR